MITMNESECHTIKIENTLNIWI